MTSDVDIERLDLVRRRADVWVKELIELSPRNTLINFKSPKTSSLNLADCEPTALSRFLTGYKTGLHVLFSNDDQHREACNHARNIHRKITMFREEQGVEVGQ